VSGGRSRWWLTAALLAEATLAALHMASSGGSFARSLYLLPVLATAIRANPRDVALVGAIAVGLAMVSPV